MWLFQRAKDKCSETVIYSNEDKVEKLEKSSTVNYEKKEVDTIEELKERVEYVKKVTSRLQIIHEKQNKNNIINTTVKTAIIENNVKDEKEKCDRNNTNKINEINNKKIDDILILIPKLENNIRTLCKKVSQISEKLDLQKLSEEIISQQIITNNSNAHSNCSKKFNSCVSSRSEASKSKKSSKNIDKKSIISKNCKRTPPIRKKESFCKKNDKVINNKTKKKLLNLNEQKEPIEKVALETNSFNCIDYMSTSTKEKTIPKCNSDTAIEHKKSSSELIYFFFANLESVLKNFKSAQESEKSEILINLTKLENKINLSECKIETLKSNLEKIFSIIPDVDSNIEIKNIECIEKYHNVEDIGFMDKQNLCELNNCVCKLIGNKNSSIKISNSKSKRKNVNSDNITLCEFLKLQPDFEDTNWKNPFEKEIILDNPLPISKSIHDEKINSCYPISIKKSLNIGNTVKLVNESKCSSKNQICDFLLSHPTPEWIKSLRQVEQMKTEESENQCEEKSKSQENLLDSTLKCKKFYNVERIINNNCCKKEIVYQISLNSSNRKIKGKTHKLDEDLVPNYTKICTS